MTRQTLTRLLLALLSAPTTAIAAEPTQAFVDLAIKQSMSSEDRESQLRQLADEHPGDARPHFELGNLLAQQRRWPEARTAYARALAAGGQRHPEIHYNLGVAFDHLEQRPTALLSYQAALQAATNVSRHLLPLAELRRRIADLEHAGP